MASIEWPTPLASVVAGNSIPADQANLLFSAVLDGHVDAVQVAELLTALNAKGIVADELEGALSAMIERSIAVSLPDPVNAVDTCGTGGDKSGSINVSTVAAFVVAGAGAKVVKHGNKAASSQCGSADVLDDLGVVIDLEADGVARCVDEAGIGFCFAPRFHPALREMAPIRKSLGVPTIFNFLGPLANPAGVGRQIVGVSNPAMAPLIIEVLRRRGLVHALVVHGDEGLDELSLSGVSQFWELFDGKVREGEIAAGDLGLETVGTDALKGGDATHNAQITRRILDGEKGAYRDVVVLNAGAGLYVAGKAPSIAEGVELAKETIDSGQARIALEELVLVSKKASG